MGSAWTDPKTFTAGMVVGETDMNTYIRDNTNALKNPPFQQTAGLNTATAFYNWENASDFTAITGLELTMTTYGGDIKCGLLGYFGPPPYLQFSYDGSAQTTHGKGIYEAQQSASVHLEAFITGLASGAHTFRPLWKAVSTRTRLDVSGHEVIFWVREQS